MTKENTKEELLQAAWQRWRDADFTWTGLTNREWKGWIVSDDGFVREAISGAVYGQPKPETSTPTMGRNATLQDYWRADPASGRWRTEDEMGMELVSTPGQPTYHRCHLPIAFANGAATGKDNWEEADLDLMVNPRLEAAAETQWDDLEVKGTDWRAQFDGGVWLKGAKSPAGTDAPLCVGYRFAMFVQFTSFSHAAFSGVTIFDHATFSGDAEFDRATFSDVAVFSDTTCCGIACFDHATFSSEALFNQTTFNKAGLFSSVKFNVKATFSFAKFSEVARFTSAAFSGGAYFDNTIFSSLTAFDQARFNGVAGFDSAQFIDGAVFMCATFSGEAWFKDVKFGGLALFSNATFNDLAAFDLTKFRGAEFDSANFNGEVDFDRAIFSGRAEFNSATFKALARFSDATFNGRAGFNNVTFIAVARFDTAIFSGHADFTSGQFIDSAFFDDATFKSEADFGTREFKGLAYFRRAKFQGETDFTAAVFDKLASFEAIVWPTAAHHWHAAFDQVLFRGTLNVSKAGFQKFAAFDGATLERGIQIDETTEATAKRNFFAERDMAIAAAAKSEPRPGTRGRWKWWLGAFRQWQSERASSPRTARHIVSFPTAPWLVAYDARLKELERGCRVLKLAMEKSSNKSREQLLYRFELLARRAQRGLPLGEALVSDLYGAMSDYGASIVRPFVALGILIVFFAGVFWGLAALLDPLTPGDPLLAGTWHAQMWSALDFSWANMFKPLSALADGANLKDGSMMELLLTRAGDGWAFGVRLIATVQSLCSIVLAFLFALAVRRRFQIS